MQEHEHPLVGSVRNGDLAAQRALLSEAADNGHAQLTAALDLAVESFDEPLVEGLLVWAEPTGWDIDRIGAEDGRTPLLRAVDRGAGDIVSRLLRAGADPRIKGADGRDALALARHWHATGTEAELRRRTRSAEPVRSRTTQDIATNTCRELSLGGLTVRDCHTAILTQLEPVYGITAPFAELLDRALAAPDIEHAVWSASRSLLLERDPHAVWDEAAALRDRPDPLARYFGTDMLYVINLLDESEDSPFDGPLVDLFLPWLEQEENPLVTWGLTVGLTNALDPRAEQPLVGLTRHPDRRVRRSAVAGLDAPLRRGDAEALATAVACTQDPDAGVRESACWVLSQPPLDSSAASDALAACLDDEAEAVRVTAATRLVLRDDPRGDELIDALDALGAVGADSPYYWQFYEARRHRDRCRDRRREGRREGR
ncbi:HEAT repeat domain-containing protein [Streptomyces sp. NPDC046261]|uniref:HEAT repeat domain-containing protein n=1 Tax=Streptomyces sp. NPDC046261 TaxID=3157200 RepID=UPI00340A9708